MAREMLARGVAKDRKNILRVLKPHLEKLCQDAEAQMVLFTAFDVVDDTKMMAKAILTVSLCVGLNMSPKELSTLTGPALNNLGSSGPRPWFSHAQDRPSSPPLSRHSPVYPTFHPFDDQGFGSYRRYRCSD